MTILHLVTKFFVAAEHVEGTFTRMWSCIDDDDLAMLRSSS
ncbi:hypothetical protein Pla52o_07350 [Novipirellula galeiformis]|uniref:Uncharacterized protein n=1 Tax=Novipirellula galeiformis TaxID=2528004 RepID=A0A5C6CQQ7_9BACT|nr:hypothetical protein [Novipirellula galeiformis]TWU26880.1 hypothetical protein Pla52o_07350 [Novipirellula galeiformis]